MRVISRVVLFQKQRWPDTVADFADELTDKRPNQRNQEVCKFFDNLYVTIRHS